MKHEEICAQIREHPIARVARETGLSRGTIYRYLHGANVRLYSAATLRRWALHRARPADYLAEVRGEVAE